MIEPANLQDLYPLSPMQEGMLFHSLLDPSSTAYLEQMTFSISGPLDIERFQEALDTLVQRQPILRTAFVYEKTKRPLQAVLKQRPVRLLHEDFRSVSPELQEERIREYQLGDRRRTFHLSKEPLLRLAMFRLSDLRCRVVWTHHHILMDGWCVGILQSEFMTVYESLVGGVRADLPPVRPYSLYLQWLEARDTTASLQYWRRTLSGYSVPATLPGRKSKDRMPCEICAFEWDGGISRRLVEFSRAIGVTINVVMQALWGVLLARYNAARDVVFGTVVSGRPGDLVGSEEILGLFINTVPVRVRLRAGESVTGLCRRIQDDQMDAEPHHYSPLSDVQALSSLKQRLLDHLFVFENYPPAKRNLSSRSTLSIELVARAEETHYDFVLVVQPGDSIHLEFQFNPGAYARSQAETIAEHYRSLVEAALGNPESEAISLSFLGKREVARLLGELAGFATEFPRASTIVDLFEEQVRKRPEAIAVQLNSDQLTYAELDRMAEGIADRLAAAGVLNESFVAIHCRRSIETIALLIGTLKTGAAYFPLDPESPSERLRLLLDDCAPVLVVSDQPAVLEKIQAPGRVIKLSSLLSSPTAEGQRERTRVVDSNQAAYVSYTSGSTGRPKGVCVTHRNVVRLVRETHYAEFNQNEVFLQMAPLAFDASTLEIWGPLLNGARLVVLPPERPTLHELGAVLRQRQITTLWLTSNLFQLMVEQELEALTGLRQILAGGEILPPGPVRRVLEFMPGCRVINGYGPTENTTFTCCHPMSRVEDVGMAVSIGRPIANTQVYLLGLEMDLVAIGEPGELFAAGDGVARGYINRPGLTAEKFVPNPFGPSGTRLYRTGDLARFHADGTLEFLGRRDHQVKLRGFRIELGEVEAALRSVPGVDMCAVTLSDDAAGNKHLVAYVTGPADLLLGSLLRRQLLERLPEYMIPSVFLRLDALPLNRNGKLDRDGLPRPDSREWVVPQRAFEPVPPADNIEVGVLQIWREVLAMPNLGMEDDFFDSGGHSLSATRIISQIRNRFRVELPLRSIFEQPTPSLLCRLLKIQPAQTPSVLDSEPKLVRRPRLGAAPSSPQPSITS